MDGEESKETTCSLFYVSTDGEYWGFSHHWKLYEFCITLPGGCFTVASREIS